MPVQFPLILLSVVTELLQQLVSLVAAHILLRFIPKLTSLLLDSLDLRTHMPPSASTILYDILMNALQQREMNKMPLKMLGVNRCVITDDYANSLREHVQELCWDGDEGVSYDEWDDYDYSLDDINLMEDVSNGFFSLYVPPSYFLKQLLRPSYNKTFLLCTITY